MMRMQPETIRLGRHHWQVRPLTVAQVQAVEPLMLGLQETGTIATAVAILRVALARDHAEAATTLDSIEATASEIAAAMRQALRLGGFISNEDKMLGEAGAG